MSFEVRKFKVVSGEGVNRWSAPYAVYCAEMDCYMFHGSKEECEAWIANGADGWA